MSRAVRIVPAVLTSDPEALSTMVRQAETFAPYVQIDIMDGRLVPSTSVTSDDLIALRPIKLHWEAHLMVQHPADCLTDFQKAGAEKVVFHFEAASSPQTTIALARKLGLGVGIAINPETPVASILPLVGEVDSVLLLTVHPGYYGAKFLPEVMHKVPELRRHYPELAIGVDGGIKETNVLQIARSGVDDICVGSAVFMQPRPEESFRHLQALAEEGARLRTET